MGVYDVYILLMFADIFWVTWFELELGNKLTLQLINLKGNHILVI